MNNHPRKLLAVIEFIEHSRFPTIYQELGFEVTTEWQVRKAVSQVRKIKPDVIVADFYSQSDFRDRLSNLESLLAASHTLKDVKILVFYEAENEPALTKVRERMHIDAALTMPVSEAALRAVLSEWS